MEVIFRCSLGGGCIGESYRGTLKDGGQVFIKTYPGRPAMVEAERKGIEAIHRVGAIRVPKVLALEEDELFLELIPEGRKTREFWEKLGVGLAQLHRHSSKEFGFEADGFIGSNYQSNAWHERWEDFFWEERILPQIRGCRLTTELGPLKDIESLVRDRLRGMEEKPSLVHGDLWSGNILAHEAGDPVLIDPAVYFGHRETDLAMARLFGGFDGLFFESYEDAWPLQEGYGEREPLYQLYHVLNHFQIFGGGYLSQARQLLTALM